MIDEWFLEKLLKLIDMERRLSQEDLSDELYMEAKSMGFLDRVITKISGKEIKAPARPVYKMVDTCAAEFSAQTPYFYSTFDEENEAEEFIEANKTGKKTIIVLAPAQSASARVLSLTTRPSTVYGRSRKRAMRSLSSTTTQKPFRPTSTRPTAFTLSRLPQKTSWV